MTRKDFDKIAEIIANIILAEEIGESARASKQMILNELAETNPRFDPVRFWEYVEKKVLENQAITK